MLTTRSKWSALCVFAISAVAAVPAYASPITVFNYSFETLPAGGLTLAACGAGCLYSSGIAIPFWTTVGTSGEFQPGTPANNTYFTSLSDLSTSAYSDTPGSIISQTPGATVLLGQMYTLRVDIGSRLDMGFAGAAALLINGNTYTAVGLQPTPGTFGTYTATYTALLADVGQAITIELLSNGAQANFDNVRLDAASIPEPASLLLIGSALLGLVGIARRRRFTTRA